MYLKNTLYKTVVYNNLNKALFINGKFSVFWLNFIFVDSMKSTLNSIYFMHDGVLYKAEKVFHIFSSRELGMIYQGKIMQVLNDCGYRCEPCKSIKEAFILMRNSENTYLLKRATVSLKLGAAELTHRCGADIIYALFQDPLRDTESMVYRNGHYRYGTYDMMVDGYPDLEDSSVCMNILLVGLRVENIQKLLTLFDIYANTSTGKLLCKKQ